MPVFVQTKAIGIDLSFAPQKVPKLGNWFSADSVQIRSCIQTLCFSPCIALLKYSFVRVPEHV